MRLIYLIIAILTFVFLPLNLAEKIKPGDPYLFVILLVIGKAFFDRRKELFANLSKIKLPIYLLMLSYLISTIFSYIPLESVKFFVRFFIYILFAGSSAALVRDKEEILSLVKFIFLLGLITGFHALYQIYNPPPVIQGISVLEGLSNVRVFATFFNANIYAEFLVIVIIFGITLFLLAESIKGKFFYFSATAFLTFILLYTYSRGSLIALFAGLSIYFLVLSPRVVVPLTSAALILAGLIPGFFERIIKTVTFQDSSQFLRLRIWHTAFATVNSIRKLVIGSGPYTFKTEVMDYVRQDPARFFGYFSFQPHNIYLMWLVEGGIVMILAWLYFFATFYSFGFNALSSLKNEENTTRLLILCLISSITALLVNGLTETIFYHYQVVSLMFLILGFILKIKFPDKEKT